MATVYFRTPSAIQGPRPATLPQEVSTSSSLTSETCYAVSGHSLCLSAVLKLEHMRERPMREHRSMDILSRCHATLSAPSCMHAEADWNVRRARSTGDFPPRGQPTVLCHVSAQFLSQSRSTIICCREPTSNYLRYSYSPIPPSQQAHVSQSRRPDAQPTLASLLSSLATVVKLLHFTPVSMEGQCTWRPSLTTQLRSPHGKSLVSAASSRSSSHVVVVSDLQISSVRQDVSRDAFSAP